MTTADPNQINVAAHPGVFQLPDIAELTSIANEVFREPAAVFREPTAGSPEPGLHPGGPSEVASGAHLPWIPGGWIADGMSGSEVPDGLPLSLVDRPAPGVKVCQSPWTWDAPAGRRDEEPGRAAPWLPASHHNAGIQTGIHAAQAAMGNLSVFEFRPEMLPNLAGSSATARRFDPHAIRRDFPILTERVHGRPLIWLDNAATTQKPQQVIDRISYYYAHENSNIHRAAHTLAARATDAYEGAREKLRGFLNAASDSEIVFVRGTTEGINLVANTWAQINVGVGDEILITHLEHHANIVPWQQLAQRTGAVLKVAPVDDTGQVIVSEFERLITPRTRIAAMTQVSNALGTITPIAQLVQIAHRHGVMTLVDAAQSVPHMKVDVAAMDADFLVFSGHKMYAPTGIGVVYAKASVWADTPPWQGGGNMIDEVTFERTTYQGPPTRFEAGTGNIADAVGLATAVDYVTAIGLENISAYEHELLKYGTAGLESIPGLRLIGTAANKAGVMSFVLPGRDPAQIGMLLDREGIAVRAGHHCAQPILRRFGVSATVRPSLAMYNTKEEVDCLIEAVARIQAGAVRI